MFTLLKETAKKQLVQELSSQPDDKLRENVQRASRQLNILDTFFQKPTVTGFIATGAVTTLDLFTDSMVTAMASRNILAEREKLPLLRKQLATGELELKSVSTLGR